MISVLPGAANFTKLIFINNKRKYYLLIKLHI